mmetsp:Transcript_17268/g.32786  ORF Transcript_17268/g.32786 Transcript_17268/m.32786 type:complete len:86 (+) Transcript_17268:77-334(+)
MFVIVEFSLNYIHEELSKRVQNALMPIEDERDANDTKDIPPVSRQGTEMGVFSQPSEVGMDEGGNVELGPSVAVPGVPAIDGPAL